MAKLSQDELKSMLPERRRAYEQRRRKVQRNRRIFAACVTLFFALIAVIVLSLTVFFKIDTITVMGDSIYEESAIIEESGIKKGKNLFLCNIEKASSSIQKNLPYISSATVKRKLPSTVIIEINGTQAAYYFKCGKGTAVTDKSLKVVEITSEDKVQPGLACVVTNNVLSADIGENIIKSNSDNDTQADVKKETELLKTVFDSIDESGIKHLTEINVTSQGNIYFVYQNRLKLNLGTTEKLTYKLKSAIEIIKQEDELNPSEKGDIFLNDTKNIYVSSEKN